MYGLTIDRTSNLPLAKQLYYQIRQSILAGRMQEGTQLPATRMLASYLHISRNVVLEVYEQLKAEGFLESRQGSYTFVAPGARLEQSVSKVWKRQPPSREKEIIDFQYGIPDLSSFPRNLWKKTVIQVMKDIPETYLGYNDRAGCIELRALLAAYLYKTRGVICSPEQIVVTSGSTQAYALIASLMLSNRRNVIIEDPLNYQVRQYLIALGCRLIPVRVDEHGLKTESLTSFASLSPSFTLVTPSHQFPTGGILPIQRRIQLVNFARKTNSYIVEDDYENEFTYEGNPIHSLQGLDPERVLYIGTFSKALVPTLRLGFIVLPFPLIDRFYNSTWFATQQPSAIDQLALASFIQSGQLYRHILKMNKIYRKRRNKIIAELNRYFADKVTVLGSPNGLHTTVEFKHFNLSPHIWDKMICQEKVRVYSVAQHVMNKKECPFLQQIILGFGNLTEDEISEGIKRLHTALCSNKKE